MAEIQEIEVTIERDGSVRLSVAGVKGQACRDLTAALEQLLGGEIVAREHTPEYYEQPVEDEQRLHEQW